MANENEEFETVELEYSEDDVLYYIVDENDEEIGFALLEDGEEVEYYYEGYDGADYVAADEAEDADGGEAEADDDAAAEEPEDEAEKSEPSTLRKLAVIAGAEADKLRGKAEKQLDKGRTVAEEQAKKAASKAKEGAKKLKSKAEDEYDLGITREGIAETTADLNAIARDGAEVAAELKGAYDDIMESFSFLKKKR